MPRNDDGMVRAAGTTSAFVRVPQEHNVKVLPFPLTDLGNAERFCAGYRDRVRYCPPRRSWLAWDGQRWRWDETGAVVRLAKRVVRGIYDETKSAANDDHRQAIARHAARSESAPRINRMIDLARTEEGIAVLPADLDADPWLLNCENGTIDLRSGELREHDRHDLVTKMAPVDYDPYASHELWTKCVRDATGGDKDLGRYLQRILGYALTGHATEKALFFFYGPTNTAKSTVLGAWMHALGDYARTAAFDTWLARSGVGGNRGDLVRLMGARLVSSVETKRGGRFDEGLIKVVTGGDEITAAAKYEAEVTFLCSFALVLAANDAPLIRDDDEAMWDRVQRVPFDHVIARPDPTFRERLKDPKVAAAVLAWGVSGCLAWQAKGLRPPASVVASTDAYRAASDRFRGFADVNLTLEAGATISRKRMREIYEVWADEEGTKALNPKELAERLRQFGAEDGKSDGNRVWKNIRERSGSRGQGHEGQEGSSNPGSVPRGF